MRKLFVIAAREYTAAVRTKAFIISLLLMPALMGGSILLQILLADKDRKIAVIDRTAGQDLFTKLEASVQVYNRPQIDPETGEESGHRKILLVNIPPSESTPEAIGEQRLDLSERVRKGEFSAVVEIGADALTAPPTPVPTPGVKEPPREDRLLVRYQSGGAGSNEASAVLSRALTTIAQRRAVDQVRASFPTIPEKAVKELEAATRRRVEVTPTGLSRRDVASGEVKEDIGKSRAAPLIVPGAFVLLMFMVIMLSSTPLMQSVVEEKMQRISEVLLGSVSPFNLMMGKLLGMTAVSLTISTVYLAGGYYAAYHYGYTQFIPFELMVWFYVFQALAALMYGSIFVAIGAAVTDSKEAQSLVMPVMLVVFLPLFLLGKVLSEPNGPVATGMSFVPFATPMVMLARQAVPPGVPWWQPWVGVILVLLTTTACVWMAGRIFRVGILMQGKGAKLSEIARWVIHG
jgi:ABC-2 type transport system permease protein